MTPKLRALAAFTAAFIFLFVFQLGCETTPVELHFKNELNTTVNVYFSSALEDDWSEEPTKVGVRSCSLVGLRFSDFDGGPGKKTDIGVIDENSINFDIYDIILQNGDVIVLSGDYTEAHFTITHSDGTANTYAATIKPSDD